MSSVQLNKIIFRKNKYKYIMFVTVKLPGWATRWGETIVKFPNAAGISSIVLFTYINQF